MEPIGYVYDAAHWCGDCLTKAGKWPDDNVEIAVMFEGEESDSPMHCDECGRFLGGQLTSEGVDALEERMLRAELREPYLSTYMRHWSWTPWAVIETHYGAFDLHGKFVG